jgi:hypothetical protein
MDKREQKMVSVVTLTLDGASYTAERALLDMVLDELRNGEEGESYTVRFHRMPAAEYDALPEFEGF